MNQLSIVDRINQLSKQNNKALYPASLKYGKEAKKIIESEVLAHTCPLDTPQGIDGAMRALSKLRGIGARRAATIINFALGYKPTGESK